MESEKHQRSTLPKDLNLAGWVKQITGKPTITVGSIGLDGDFMELFRGGKDATNVGIESLVQKLEHDEFDLVAIGRGLLVDPEWATKIREGRLDDLVPFTPEALKSLY